MTKTCDTVHFSYFTCCFMVQEGSDPPREMTMRITPTTATARSKCSRVCCSTPRHLRKRVSCGFFARNGTAASAQMFQPRHLRKCFCADFSLKMLPRHLHKCFSRGICASVSAVTSAQVFQPRHLRKCFSRGNCASISVAASAQMF